MSYGPWSQGSWECKLLDDGELVATRQFHAADPPQEIEAQRQVFKLVSRTETKPGVAIYHFSHTAEVPVPRPTQEVNARGRTCYVPEWAEPL